MALRAPVAAAALLLALLLLLRAGQVQAAKCAFRADGKPCPLATDCCNIYGWCGSGPRFCAAGRCLGGACDGEALPEVPGCSGECTAFAGEASKAKAICRGGLIITSVKAPTTACNLTGTNSALASFCLGKRFCHVAASDLPLGGEFCPLWATPLRFTYSCWPLIQEPSVPSPPSPSSSSDGNVDAVIASVRAVSAREGLRAVASCPKGLLVTAVSNVVYGNTAAKCAATLKVYRVISSSCLGKPVCAPLARDDFLGGNPCPRGQPKTLSYRYLCGPVPPINGARAVRAIEGQMAVAWCPKGQVMYSVWAAVYGNTNKNCKSPSSQAVVNKACLKRSVCLINVASKFFGVDPCRGIFKALSFKYRCGVPLPPVVKPGNLRTATAPEGKRAVASCPRGQEIKTLTGVFFGRLANKGCKSPNSYRVVARSCLRKTTCAPLATSSFFGGDPCRGVAKILWFRYTCGLRVLPAPTPRRPPPPKPRPSPKPVPLPVDPVDPPPPTSPGTQASLLWGTKGERWRATGKVPDHSYAGYMASERNLPWYTTIVNVKDAEFGAVGNGIADDTNAIIRAIAKAGELALQMTTVECGRRRCPKPHNGFQNEGREGVAVLMPAGTYRITRMLDIYQSNVVLRGEGVGKTTLYFPKGLQHVYGKLMNWAFMGGYLVLRGRNYDSVDRQYLLAEMTATAVKGSRRVQVSSTAGIRVGQWVRIYARAPSRRSRRLLLGEEQAIGTDVNRTAAEAAAGTVSLTSMASAPAPLAASTTGAGAALASAPAPEQDVLPRPGVSPPPMRSSPPPPSPSSPPPPKPGSPPPRQPSFPPPPPLPSYLPLPQVFVEAGLVAEQMGLFREDEHLDPSEGVSAAAGDGTLDAYLYGENRASSASPYRGERIRFASRVRRVGNGWIEFERPLPYDVCLAWQPAIYEFAPPLQHSGFEHFTVQFKHDLYPSHMKVFGYNAFWIYGSANAWIREVHIIDADTGAEAQNSDFVTMTKMSFDITAPRGNRNTQDCDGHHGAWSAASSNVLITEFDFRSRFVHDLTLDVFSQECVYNNGKGVDMSLDMHRSAVHNNLLSNIDVGAGTRPFSSSGQVIRGAHAAANNTWWNIYSSRGTDLNLPDCDFGPLLNFVGSYAPPENSVTPGNCIRNSGVDAGKLLPAYCPAMLWYVEQHSSGKQNGPALFDPVDLFGAMLRTRADRLGL